MKRGDGDREHDAEAEGPRDGEPGESTDALAVGGAEGLADNRLRSDRHRIEHKGDEVPHLPAEVMCAECRVPRLSRRLCRGEEGHLECGRPDDEVPAEPQLRPDDVGQRAKRESVPMLLREKRGEHARGCTRLAGHVGDRRALEPELGEGAEAQDEGEAQGRGHRDPADHEGKRFPSSLYTAQPAVSRCREKDQRNAPGRDM